jgi:hypothetical protein
MVTSEFFTYRSGYVISDTILPGIGYWAKVAQPGQLIFSASETFSSSQYIRIVEESEKPPQPPFEVLFVDENLVPLKFALYQNYPNPFNPSTTIHFDIQAKSHIKLDVFNVLGMHMKTLVNEIRDAGTYDVVWDGTDDAGHAVSTGSYYYRLSNSDMTCVLKGILIK